MDIDYFVKPCPHCDQCILLLKSEINCRIYRHGVFKNTMTQIDPHSSKELCEKYVKEDLIYGCGKPFYIEIIESDIILYICDYI